MTYLLREDLEEGYGIGYALDMDGYLKPTVELSIMAPGGGVLLLDCGGENLSEILLCSMEFSCRLQADRRGRSIQGFCCGKERLKWTRNTRFYRCVRRDTAPDIVLSYP